MSRRAVPVVLAAVFAAVLISFLVYTRQMENVLRRDAEVFRRIYVEAFQGVTAATPARKDEALSEIHEQSLRLQIPVVVTDSAGRPTSAANLPFEADLDDPASLRSVRRFVDELDARRAPYEVPGYGLRIHFGEPLFLGRLKWIPWLQAAVLVVTVAAGAWLVWTSFRAERERIWSAMARESAHQMGTPLSSLVGWLGQLRAGPAAEQARRGDVDVLEEMEADVNRLLKVSNRFEAIGRAPSLRSVDVGEVVERLERYFSLRLPSMERAVDFRTEIPPDAPRVRANEMLLEWALENLVKNSLDALAGRDGEIGIEFVERSGDRAVFRVYDTGPGVDPDVRKRLFDIGVSTKDRGWGVGLSLTRRIIEEMHDGEISLEPDVAPGASFRIELPLAEDGEGSARA